VQRESIFRMVPIVLLSKGNIIWQNFHGYFINNLKVGTALALHYIQRLDKSFSAYTHFIMYMYETSTCT